MISLTKPTVKKAIAHFLIASATISSSSMAYSKSKPNFILIIADDVSWNDFGCYGNKVVRTPHIDRLAQEGIIFTNAFLTASSCSPSRCSIISGKYPHSNGAAELHTPLPSSEVPFPLVLKEMGYYTAQAGKWHMGEDTYRAFFKYTDKNKFGYDNGNGGEANWIPFLKERPKDKPFFFWFAAYDAHRDWGADEFGTPHSPNSVIVPPFLADDSQTRQDIASYYNEISRFDYYVGAVRKELEEQGELHNTVILVMADNGRAFPRCKTRVYDSGMKTPFVFFWPKGIRAKGKKATGLISAIDIAPTILELAGASVPSAYQGESFVSILKDNEHKTRELVFSEHNWHDYEAHERMVRSEQFLYILNARPNLPNGGPADSKRSPSQKALNQLRDLGKLSSAQSDVFSTPRPAEELYDIKKDPYQLVNLASLPEFKDQLLNKRKQLKEWQEKTGDTTPTQLTQDWFDRESGKNLFQLNGSGE